MNSYLVPLLMTALGLFMISASTAEAGSPDLRVMSFNIRNGRANDGEDRWDNRKEQVADLIRREKIDLLGIQEAYRDQIDFLLKALPEYGEVGGGRDDGKDAGEHSQVLYRKDRFRVEEGGTFWFSDTPETPGSMHWGNRIPRICTWARLTDLKAKRPFYLYNLHLDHQSQPSRERSAKLLLERIRGRNPAAPVLVMGDFNAGEDNAAIRQLKTEASPALLDTFRIRHPDAKEVGTFHGFGGKIEGNKIDYIFATEEFRVRDAAILHDHRKGRYPSDHFPVVARLSWR